MEMSEATPPQSLLLNYAKVVADHGPTSVEAANLREEHTDGQAFSRFARLTDFVFAELDRLSNQESHRDGHN